MAESGRHVRCQYCNLVKGWTSLTCNAVIGIIDIMECLTFISNMVRTLNEDDGMTEVDQLS